MSVADSWIEQGFQVRPLLRIAGVPSSTYYWRRKHRKQREKQPHGGRPIPGITWTLDGRSISDEAVKALLVAAVSGEGYSYGYQKLTHWLRREHSLVINKKKVYRLCRELGILRPQRARRGPQKPRRVALNRRVTGVNQVWETDIKYGYIPAEKRFFFIQVVLDVYDRMVVDFHIGLSCTGLDAGRALQGAYQRRRSQLKGGNLVIRTDNGPQFTSRDFEQTCANLGVEHEYIPVQTPNKIAHIEAFHSILEEECLSAHEFRSFPEAYVTVVEFIDHYNGRRIHGSLGYRTPKEYHEASQTKTASASPIKL